MIKTVNLQKIFKTEEVQTLALNDVNIEVKEGYPVPKQEPRTEPPCISYYRRPSCPDKKKNPAAGSRSFF